MSAADRSEAVLASIAALASKELDHEGPMSPATRLVDDLALDSLRMMTLAVAVEDHFLICLDEADEARLETIGDLVAVVLAKTAARDG